MTMTSPRAAVPDAPSGPMTHRDILEALSGLLLALFVAMLSSTVVSNALPRIVAELEGTESGYTWVVVATLLTTTASTPVWGKLADLVSKKLLVQIALVIFAIGSSLAGLSQSMGFLIGARALQGIGVGGLTALVQVVIASMVTPRERGRYSGYIGAVFAVATVSGPLIGGVIVDTSWLGWRWCFYVGLPVALAAFVVLQKTLHLPVVRRDDVAIDYLGAGLITGGVSLLLIWVSMAGNSFAWASTTTTWMVGLGVLLLMLAVVAELKAAEPVIPLRLFRDRTTSLSTFASTMVGVAMFGSTVFLSQYFQISRGMTPTVAGLMSTPMVIALMVSSLVTGRRITATGRWKHFLVGGMVLVVAGMCLLSTIDDVTNLWLVGLYMAVLGLGMGAAMQNLVLAVQNNTAQADMGAASSIVAFFRTMGGSIGVSALGAALGHQVAANVVAGLAKIGASLPPGTEGHSIPNMATIQEPFRGVIEHAYGVATGHIFLVAAPVAALALVAVLFIKEVPLRVTLDHEEQRPVDRLEAEVEATVQPGAPA